MEDQEQFEVYIKPFLEKEGLPTDSAFIERMSKAFIESSVQLVHFRKERSLERMRKKKLS